MCLDSIVNAVNESMSMNDRINSFTEDQLEQRDWEQQMGYHRSMKLCEIGLPHDADDEDFPEDTCCSFCNYPKSVVNQRCGGCDKITTMWDGEMSQPAKFMCYSCYSLDHPAAIESCCFNCGLSPEFEDIYRGQSFYQRSFGSVCHDCMGMIEEANPLVNGFDSDEETFEEEYEVDELPENNTEKVKKVKEIVKTLGEKIYELQEKEKLQEGEYLEMMNLLQQITNGVNEL
tara:strand:- start:2594 stop:3286 length:693 start_codon:yes stop_codon:yes gene_type:complete